VATKLILAALTAFAFFFAGSGGTSFAKNALHVRSYRPYLGVRVIHVTDEIARYIAMKEPRGALALGNDQSPAKSAGIEPSDVIVKFDGRNIGRPIDVLGIVADATIEQLQLMYQQRLAAMLQELRSLGTDERAINRFHELDGEHQALVQHMPPDVANALKGLNDSFVTEYAALSIAVRKAEEQLRQRKEAEEKVAEQSQQLQLLYLYYMELQVCAERFSQFEHARSGLKDVLRSIEKETGLSTNQVQNIWNATAEKFKELEPVLKVAGDAQLFTECDQNSRNVAGLILRMPGMGGGSEGTPLRKKDF
jgi:hypothetical protein